MMHNLATWLGVGVAAYLLGCIPTGYLLGKLKGVDIRRLGSGNIGATNVFRCLGKKLGALTLTVDFLKGLLPVMLARRVLAGDASNEAAVMTAALAVAGHVWPITMGFRGGKGVATAAGGLVGVVPLAMGVAMAVWLTLFLALGYVSVASISAAVAVTLAAWIWPSGGTALVPSLVTVLAAVSIWRHRANMVRLIQGTEPRSGWPFRRKAADTRPAERKTV